MAADKIFVGRKDELGQFKEVLEEPQGQAVLVVGQAGMGKTWLVNEMVEAAYGELDLECGWVRYEVTPNDTPDSTMALMMDNAFEAAQVTERSFDGTGRTLEQWRSVLNVINIGDLVMSLRRDPAKNTREQFIKRLRLISKRMLDNGRAIFVIDPEKYMRKDSDQDWAIVVRELPEKIKFVFAQRPEDVLVESETLGVLENVRRVPEERLGVLEEEAVDKLVTSRAQAGRYSAAELREGLARYEGHPYALGAALDLIEAGAKTEELPERPEPVEFAKVQWGKVYQISDEAVKLLEAYAVLEVGVPNEVVEAVSGLEVTTRKRLQKNRYLRSLLREEENGKRIYHAILADFVLDQIGEQEKAAYHERAVGIYRGKLAATKKAQSRPDALAAMRLAEHVLAAEGKEAFVNAFINECYGPLTNLGLLDSAVGLSERGLKMVGKGSAEEAALRGNLGLIYRMRGDLEKAEEMLKKSLEISEPRGIMKLTANQYGNLGTVYYTKGDLDKAEEMFMKILKIHKKLGDQEGMASDYGNLGLIEQDRGELDKAEEMFRKSLEISEPRGMMELTANQYGNLGLIEQRRGDLDKAEEMFRKSLEISETRGMMELTANQYGNLGLIERRRGDLDKAEEMFRKSLEISETRGMMELTANQYGNLGLIYGKRGDKGKARGYWEKAVELYKKIGMPHMVEKVEGWMKEE